MQVNYCDLCNSPLKDNNFYSLYIAEPKQLNNLNNEDYYIYMQDIQKKVKQICPACKIIFDKMFELRLQKLSELTEEIWFTYNLKSKDDKNGKEEK